MFRYPEIQYWIIKLYTLLPHKSKEFIKPTADILKQSNLLIEDVTTFYWQQVRFNLSNPTDISINVAYFGSFTVKPWKLDQFILKYQNIVEHTELDTFVKFASVKQLEKRKIILDKLILRLAEYKVKKQSVKDKRYGKGIETSLEKQKTYPGRT